VPVGGYDPEEIIPLNPPMVNGGVPQGGWFWVPAREGGHNTGENGRNPSDQGTWIWPGYGSLLAR
jgi:hypothetical protein